MFPGQGGQWAGMALDLYHQAEPVFAPSPRRLRHRAGPAHRAGTCTQALADARTPWTGPTSSNPPCGPSWSPSPPSGRHHGITPDAVIGHSQGEIAAAHIAGALTLEDSARIVALRAQAITTITGHGAMASIALPEAEVVRRWGTTVAVAAVNGPQATVIAGAPEVLAGIAAACAAEDVRAKILPVDYASHSPHVEPLRAPLATALAGIRPRTADIPFYSTVTGEPLDTTTLTADYWFTNLRRTVQFEPTVRRLHADGHTTFLEVSPHPVLTGVTEEITGGTALGTLRRDEGDRRRFLTALADAYVAGLPVDWRPAYDADARPVELPTYAFARTPYWLETPAGPADATGLGLTPAGHPLLGAAVDLADDDGLVLTGRLSRDSHRWLADHTVAGAPLVPGAAFVELAAQAADAAGAAGVAELTLQTPCVLPDRGGVDVQVQVRDGTLTVHTRTDGGSWTRNAAGVLLTDDGAAPATLDVWPPRGAVPVDTSALYPALAEAGYRYGPAFQGLRAAWRRDDEVYAEARLPEGMSAEGFGLHPALLDAALHALAAGEFLGAGVRLPFAWTGIRTYATGADAVRVRIRPAGTDTVAVDLADATGAPVAAIESLVLRAAPAGTGTVGAADVLVLDWHPLTLPDDAAAPPDLLVVAPSDPDDPVAATHRLVASTASTLAARLAEDRGAVVVTRNAVAARPGDPDPDLAHAAVWGLLRSAQTENPDRFTVVDTDGLAASEAALAAAVATGEPQVAVRAGHAYVPRLARAGSSPALVPPPGAWRLDTPGGTVDDLRLVALADTPLAPGQVRVAVRACGLNFRDVLIALGMVPGAARRWAARAPGSSLEVGRRASPDSPPATG